MKFSHELQNTLAAENFPSAWVQAAIPYGRLKKCIKRLTAELTSLGLDVETLRNSARRENRVLAPLKGQKSPAIVYEYGFSERTESLKPRLTLYVEPRESLALAASSPDTQRYFDLLAAETDSAPDSQQLNGLSSTLPPARNTNICNSLQQVEIPLSSDSEFFGILQGDVLVLDALQTVEQQAVVGNIGVLRNNMMIVAAPSRRRRMHLTWSSTDLERWREIFDIYLQAAVFFSTSEHDHGTRTSTKVLQQLQWFQNEVQKRGLAKGFKLEASRGALDHFVSINWALLRNLKFQEVNQRAVIKILKKFDKRTALGVKDSFPKLLQSAHIMSESMAKAVCSVLAEDVIKLVPQLDDYLCLVCSSISYKPIRLKCQHVFCIRCVLLLQRQEIDRCPLCRRNGVLSADRTNVDDTLKQFLKQYFPREAKIKQRENRMAAGMDQYGPDFDDAFWPPRF